MKKRDVLGIVLCVCLVLIGASALIFTEAFCRQYTPRAVNTPTPVPTPVPTQTPVPSPTPEPTPEPTPSPTPKPTPTPVPYVPPRELEDALALNPHVIGWLEIPDTFIRYPILQHPTQDNYYLNVTIEGGTGYPGSIYTNSMEGRDFDTFNTVIYGHNMANGTYFGSLKNYNDADFLAAHREIDIYTPTREHRYDVIAVVCYDDRYITDFYDDAKDDDRLAFLKSLKNFGAVFPEGAAVSLDGHIITLSTCIGGMPNNRLLIVAAEREDDDNLVTEINF